MGMCLRQGMGGKRNILALEVAINFEAKQKPDWSLAAIGEDLAERYVKSGYKYGSAKYFEDGVYREQTGVDDGIYERVAQAHEYQNQGRVGKL